MPLPQHPLAANPLTIAHGGHRDLWQEDLPLIRQRVDEWLQSRLQEAGGRTLLLLSGIAEGADELVVEAAASAGIAVMLLLIEEEEESTRAERAITRFGTLVKTHRLDIPDRPQGPTARYEWLARTLASNAEHILVLWDGVFTGKPGGTSDLVHLALRRKTGKGTIHQLVTPRRSNPFPLSHWPAAQWSFFPSAGPLEWASRPFPDTPAEDPVPWFNRHIAYNENFWRFLLPVLFVVLTVWTGYLGFLQLHASKPGEPPPPLSGTPIRWDADLLFEAVNLVTFNASVFGRPPEEIPLLLEMARFFGLAFVVNAFIVAFMLAIGGNNKNLLRFWIWKLARIRNIALVTGLHPESFALSLALKSRGYRTILVDRDPDPALRTEAARRGIRVVAGPPFSGAFLRRIQVKRAQAVYLMEESDEDNVRSFQEMDQLWRDSGEPVRAHIFLRDERLAGFVGKLERAAPQVRLHVLNPLENIARRLLVQYPPVNFRHGEAQPAEVLLFGLGEMGRLLLINLLRHTGGAPGGLRRITVFAEDAEKAGQKLLHQFPCLWHDAEANPLYERSHTKALRDLLFPAGLLRIVELPFSDSGLYHHPDIQRAFSQDNPLLVYFCLDQPVQNAAGLHVLLQQARATTRNIRFFCYYPVDDESQPALVEHMLNRNMAHRPAMLFGQSASECRRIAADDETLDDLPALLHFWYTGAAEPSEWLDHPSRILDQARKEWTGLGYTHQQSSRHAADHIWTKLRQAGFPLSQLGQPGLSDALRDLFSPGKLRPLVEAEHLRWCAEKLLDGFLPLQDHLPDDSANPGAYMAYWKRPGFKSLYQAKKFHIDLVPYDRLFTGELTVDGKKIRVDEQHKDDHQIGGIAFMLHVLTQPRQNFRI